MEKQKIDRFIDAFRNAMYHEFKVEEEGMVANAPGAQGGFGGSSAPQGPTAGYDIPMGKKPEQRIDGRRKYVNQLISNREKRKNKKAMKNAMNFNPYFK